MRFIYSFIPIFEYLELASWKGFALHENYCWYPRHIKALIQTLKIKCFQVSCTTEVMSVIHCPRTLFLHQLSLLLNPAKIKHRRKFWKYCQTDTIMEFRIKIRFSHKTSSSGEFELSLKTSYPLHNNDSSIHMAESRY